MVTRWFLFGFISLLSLTLSAYAADWKQQKYTADGFQVEFSGATSVTDTEISAETKKLVVRSTNYLQDGGAFAYIASATLYKNGANIVKGSEASFATGKCNTKTQTDIAASVAGAKGLSFVGSDCDQGRRWEARYFVKGKWFYQALAIFAADGDTASARHFLDSFKLLDTPN